MLPPSDYLVSDAGVISDLCAGNLLRLLPGLPFQIMMPDILVQGEFLEPIEEDLLEAGWLEPCELSGEDLERIIELRDQ